MGQAPEQHEDVAQDANKGLVWDWPTRLVHWSLAVCFAGSWLTAELGFDWTEVHFRFGYTMLGLVVFRILWGIVGPRHARFTSFLRGPGRIAAYLRGQSPGIVGHNPLGALAVIALLLALATQAVTGLFISDDIFYAGPYNGAVSSDLAGQLAGIHGTNFHVLQALVLLHLVAIGVHRYRGDRLVGPMVSGYKTLDAEQMEQQIASSRSVLALVLAAVVAAGVYLLLELAPPPAMMDFS